MTEDSKSSRRHHQFEESEFEPNQEDQEEEEDSDSSWEETLLYIELDEPTGVEEIFKKKRDNEDHQPAASMDRITPTPSSSVEGRNRTSRGRYGKRTDAPPAEDPTTKFKSQESPNIELTFHNMEGDEPMLEFQGRFYSGKYEEPPGTCLFFSEKTPAQSTYSDPTHSPLIDPLFGQHPNKQEYELLTSATKMCRMKLVKVEYKDEPKLLEEGYIKTYEEDEDEEVEDDADEDPLVQKEVL